MARIMRRLLAGTFVGVVVALGVAPAAEGAVTAPLTAADLMAQART